MAETIYTIPITRAHEQGDRCPFCVLRAELEAQVVDYISGPAMMEPDVRMETNRLGFCHSHYEQLRAGKNRLGLALILESHLAEVAASLGREPAKRGLFSGRDEAEPGRGLTAVSRSCYVCDRLETLEGRVIQNALHLFDTDSGFRAKLTARRDYCLPHAAMLLESGGEALGGGAHRDLTGALCRGLTAQIEALSASIKGFAAGFDYRNTGRALSDREKSSIEDAVAFLTGGRR